MTAEIDARRLRKVMRELEEESGRRAAGKRRSKAKKKAVKRRRRPKSEDHADAPLVLPPIPEGRWTPPGIAFEMLPRPLQAALVELIGPLYEELVLAAPDALERSTGLTLNEAERLLCKESGLKALSGGFNDMRDILEQGAKGNAHAQLAFEVFVHQARQWVGSFFLQMNGADALVFTAGIGENQPVIRQAVCSDLDALGIVLDPEKNKATGATEATISAPDSRVKVMVIPTNEELVVAREVKRFLEKPDASPAATRSVKRKKTAPPSTTS